MTDRIKGFIVTLDADMRADDAESLVTAIAMMRHVANVEPVATNIDDHINRERIRRELTRRIYAALDGNP